ncbi:MAG: tyrosine-protein kinase domain-containing protein [Flammeovirgaceae bacterium]
MSYNVIDRQPLPQIDDVNTFEDKGTEINFDKLIFIIRKRLVYLILMLISGIIGAFIYLRYTTAIYEATAQIKLDYKTSSQIIDIDMPIGIDGGNTDYLAGEMQIIKSNPIYQSVLDSLDLYVSYFAKGDIIDSEIYKSSPLILEILSDKKELLDRKFDIELLNNEKFNIQYLSKNGEKISQNYNFGEVINIDNLSFKVILISQKQNSKYSVIINSESTLFRYFDKNLTVSIFNPQSKTISLSLKDNNPIKAVDILNTVIKAYYIKSIEKKNRAFEQAIYYLNDQIKATRDSLDDIERAIQANLKNVKEKPLSEEIAMKLSRISSLENKKIELKISYEYYEKLEKVLPKDTTFIYLSTLATLTGNENLQEYIKKMIIAKNEYDRIQSYYKSTTFSRQQRAEEVKKQKNELLGLIQFHKNLIIEQMQENDKELEEYKNSLYSEDDDNTELKKLTKNYSIYENISNLMLEKVVELNIAKSSTTADFQIINKPSVSKKPIYPVPHLAYGIGLGIGFTICIWYVVLVYVLDNKINSIKDIDRKINLPILGLLPYMDSEVISENSKLIVDINPKSAISEAFRSIRTNLDFIGANQKKKVITVTSTISGEGKTFIAVNLAGIIALSGTHKVVVIDLDMRKPKIHKAFDGENTIGVSSVLIGKSSLEDVITDTHISTLKYITSGPIPPNPSELLLSERFSTMLEALQKEFDIIILDTPPVGLVTDGILIMKKATIPLYVMRAGYSKLNFVENIQKLVTINKFNNISIILNAVDASSGYGYGSGYYKYGYLYGGGTYGYGEEVNEKSNWYEQIISRFKSKSDS